IVLLRSHPSGASTAAEIRHFYLGKHAGRVSLVGVYLAPFSGIAFLWFIAVLRNLIGDREDRFFATVFLASGLLFVAMLFVAAGVGGALLTAVKFEVEPLPSADTVVAIRWLVATGYGAALVLILNVSYSQALVLVFPVWVAAVSIVILATSRSPSRTT